MEPRKPPILSPARVGIFLAIGAAAAMGFFLPRHAPTVVARDGAEAVPSALLAADSSPLPTPSAVPSPAVVYVCGAVRKPGVYRLAHDARVTDAIERAGGPLADADLEQLNLAAPALDAMKIRVPKKGESPPPELVSADRGVSNEPAGSGRPAHRRSSGGRHKLQAGQTLDINTAGPQELVMLPGVGPSLAQRIIDYRTTNGPFQTIDDLLNVSGIGPTKLDKMTPYIKL